jgi:hypothetical protein
VVGTSRVHFYRDRGLAQDVLEAGLEAAERIAEGTGMSPIRPIRIYIYASQRDMAGAIPSRSEAFDSRTVTLGMSMGADALVLLGTDSGILGTTAMSSRTRSSTSTLTVPSPTCRAGSMRDWPCTPRVTSRATTLARLERALTQGRLLSLRSMTSYPGDAQLVDLFYGQAYSIVAYLIEAEDAGSIEDLLALLADGVPVDEALRETYGFGLEELEAGWLEHLGVAEPAAVTSGTIGRMPVVAVTPEPLAGLELLRAA